LLYDDFLYLIVDEDGLFGQFGHSLLTHVGSVDDHKLRVLLGLQYFVDLLKLVDDLHLATVVLPVGLATALRLKHRKVEVFLRGGKLIEDAVTSEVLHAGLVTHIVHEFEVGLQGLVLVLPHDDL
jgi:hypothetical protein